ncbi:MAG TPA: hypothetical protein VHU87_07625 [Rhizomicrobium sp.]|jgi:predicted ABC-type ATPase|nr:hypothetical protein [Rhizomicrobium sp.]
MSHPSKIDVLRRARALGYFNILYFVGTESPELNVARVAQRVALGGHDVPEDRIVARYKTTMALLPKAVAECDRTVLFDNSYHDAPGGPVKLSPFCEIIRKSQKIEMAPQAPGNNLFGDAGPVPGWMRKIAWES